MKKWFFVGVETRCLVTEKPADVKEIAGSASKIENVERRGAIEPEILGTLHVDADPIGCVFVGVDPSRVRPIWIMFPQPFQFGPINRMENSLSA